MTKLGLVLIAALAACQSKNASNASPNASPNASSDNGTSGGAAVAGAGSGASSPTGASEPAGRNMSGPRTRLAANCPSMLPGTTTQLAMTARGVDVTVTAKDPAVARRIAALGRGHALGRAAGTAQPHDQQHGGLGTVGYCPIIVNDQTTVSVTPVAGGVTAHVEAASPDRVTALQAMIKARAVRLPGYTSS